jgi:nicotinamide mononucleotide adenylyltransferase
MISFKIFFEQNVNNETVALLPGGFKPPTKGHFEALEDLLQAANKGVVFIGKESRDGITQDQSYQIWSIYSRYLSKPVDVIKSPVTPVKSTYDYAIEHSNYNIIVGAGAKDADITRYNSFIKNPDKYPNVVGIEKINIKREGISGTETRERILAKDPSVVDYFVPEIVNQTDKDRIKQILGIV